MNSYGKYCIICAALLASSAYGADQRQGGSWAYHNNLSIGGAGITIDSTLHTIDLAPTWSDSLTVIVQQQAGSVGARKIVLQHRDYFVRLGELGSDSLTAWSTPDTIQALTRKVVRVFKGYGTHKQLRFRTTPNDSTGFGAGTATAASKIKLGVIGTTNR